ncbi:MAG TPA: hypothetical protein VG965_02905 [Patescibacteria group bacterium]|nr:hypothetical protein [Patescibacteria group bacterium]
MPDISPEGIEFQVHKTREVKKEDLYSTLAAADRQNLDLLVDAFEDISENDEVEGGMFVVGGILNKPHPRKDIDIVVYRGFPDAPATQTPLIEKSQLTLANEKFAGLRLFANEFVKRNPDFKIGNIIEPFEDENFDNPNILRNTGSIEITREGSTTLQLVNGYDGPVGSDKSDDRQFAVLTRVEKTPLATAA